jgi:hypothetical protein
LFVAAPFAYAQLNAVPAPVQYIVSPQTPGPNTQVTIEAQGVGNFLGNSTITWSINGKVVLQGVGARDLTFTTGALGTQTRVHVAINSNTEGTLSNDWVFTPSSVIMLWEADTSVPPLYRGKALYSGGSNLKVVAFPSVAVNGKSISSNNLSFQWTVNDAPVPQMSGLGQNSLSFTGDQLQSQENVEVAVSYGANQVGYGQVVIPATTPQVLMYQYDPLRGLLLDSTLPSALNMTAKELTVVAVPYYFANQSLANGSATYAWTLNGDDTTGPNATKGMLTLRQTGTGAGAAVVGVSVQNTDTSMLVQAAQAVLQVIFGQSGSSGSPFGL